RLPARRMDGHLNDVAGRRAPVLDPAGASIAHASTWTAPDAGPYRRPIFYTTIHVPRPAHRPPIVKSFLGFINGVLVAALGERRLPSTAPRPLRIPAVLLQRFIRDGLPARSRPRLKETASFYQLIFPRSWIWRAATSAGVVELI